MSSKLLAIVDHETSVVQKFRLNVRHMVQLRQASLLHAMRNRPAEFMPNHGQSESGSAEAALL